MDSVQRDLDDRETEGGVNIQDIKTPLEIYAFLAHCLVEKAESRWKREKQEQESNPSAASASSSSYATGKTKSKLRGGSLLKKGSGASAAAAIGGWGWISHRYFAMELYKRFLSMDLKRIIISSPDRATLVSMIIKSVSHIMEEPENMRASELSVELFQIMALAVTEYENVVG